MRSESYTLDEDLIFHTPSLPAALCAVSLTLVYQGDGIVECWLTAQIGCGVYRRIDAQALFNFDLEVRQPLAEIALQPDAGLQIDACLDPSLLPELTEHADTASQAAAYLQTISQEQPNHSLLSTSNWYALSIYQEQASGRAGYRTLWYYLRPSALSEDNFSPEAAAKIATDFVRQIVQDSALEVTQDILDETASEFRNLSE
ncbi:MAG: hypothetical protein WBA10_20405, partial [Elainellaceae cyanobacterium]